MSPDSKTVWNIGIKLIFTLIELDSSWLFSDTSKIFDFPKYLKEPQWKNIKNPNKFNEIKKNINRKY